MEEKGFSHTLQKTASSCQYAVEITYFCKLKGSLKKPICIVYFHWLLDYCRI